jgi:hypothetical protein
MQKMSLPTSNWMVIDIFLIFSSITKIYSESTILYPPKFC